MFWCGGGGGIQPGLIGGIAFPCIGGGGRGGTSP